MVLSGVNGLRMLGVVHDAVVFLLEQLYGARYCRNYRFRFHKPEEVDEPPLNPHGSARAEVHHRYVALPLWLSLLLCLYNESYLELRPLNYEAPLTAFFTRKLHTLFMVYN